MQQQQSRSPNPHGPARPTRCRLILDLLQSFDRRERERILVIGAAAGALAADLHRRFPAADIVGVEGSREDVELARVAVPSATFIQRDLLREEEVDPRLRRLGDRGVVRAKSWSTSTDASAVAARRGAVSRAERRTRSRGPGWTRCRHSIGVSVTGGTSRRRRCLTCSRSRASGSGTCRERASPSPISLSCVSTASAPRLAGRSLRPRRYD